MRNKELEVKIANKVFPQGNFTLEDLDQRILVCLESFLGDEELEKLFYACYDKFGEDREGRVSVFEIDGKFYITADEDEGIDIYEERPDDWIGTFSYFVTEVDEYAKKRYYPFLEDTEYEYWIELDQFE